MCPAIIDSLGAQVDCGDALCTRCKHVRSIPRSASGIKYGLPVNKLQSEFIRQFMPGEDNADFALLRRDHPFAGIVQIAFSLSHGSAFLFGS
jgi:hypothetical protein